MRRGFLYQFSQTGIVIITEKLRQNLPELTDTFL